jgi:PAS domain S-box-containing protein
MPKRPSIGDRESSGARSRQVVVLAVAGAMFAGVSVLRASTTDVNHPFTFLYVLPIAVIAVELGLAWGLRAAAFSLALFALWDVTWPGHAPLTVFDYLSRGVVFFVLGGVAGVLADRLRRLSAESSRFWTLSPSLFCIADLDGYFTRINPAWERTLGWTTEELCARPFAEFVHPDDRDRTIDEDAKLSGAASETLGFENRYRHKDGSYRTLLWGATSIPERGVIYASASDITGVRAAEQIAEAARGEAERANQAKNEFLSRMSHELRTPLNAVIGFGQLLELDDLAPSQRESAQHILKGARHLLELINEVLDISQIESGTMSLSVEPVHLGSVLADALSLIRPLADEMQVHVVADPAELVSFHVLADQQRLKQVLINLLSNAVKYNRRGGEISVHCTRPFENRVEVAISDTGLGMNSDQLERLFDPFDRLGAEGTSVEGTGLGLPLSMRLIEAMNGTLHAESEPNTGTTMRVQLNEAQSPDDPPEATLTQRAAINGAPLKTRSIVYIEDNLTNLRLLERLLEPLPHTRVIPAMHGTLGIELARQHQPDLILLDLHLPDLNGLEILQRLKRDPVTAPIPVIVLSADAAPSQLTRLESAGATSYLSKPIDLVLLRKAIEELALAGET